jgi:hypothetical protein
VLLLVRSRQASVVCLDLRMLSSWQLESLSLSSCDCLKDATASEHLPRSRSTPPHLNTCVSCHCLGEVAKLLSDFSGSVLVLAHLCSTLLDEAVTTSLFIPTMFFNTITNLCYTHLLI